MKLKIGHIKLQFKYLYLTDYYKFKTVGKLR